MSIQVTKAMVKSKCRIIVSDFDTEIETLIEEQLPVIEFAILEHHLNDTSNVGLQATLTLGATEIISGEFLAQSFREPGASETLVFGDLVIGARPGSSFSVSIADPFGLKSQGWQRLTPYLKPQLKSDEATSTAIFSPKRKFDDEVARW